MPDGILRMRKRSWVRMHPGSHGKLSVPESWLSGKETEWDHQPARSGAVAVVRSRVVERVDRCKLDVPNFSSL